MPTPDAGSQTRPQSVATRAPAAPQRSPQAGRPPSAHPATPKRFRRGDARTAGVWGRGWGGWPGTRLRAAAPPGRASGRATHAWAAAALRAAAGRAAQSASQPATRRSSALAQRRRQWRRRTRTLAKGERGRDWWGSGARRPRGAGARLAGPRRRGLAGPPPRAARRRNRARSAPDRCRSEPGRGEVTESDPGGDQRPLDPAQGSPRCGVSVSPGS